MEDTKVRVVAQLGAQLPRSTVLDELPHKAHTPHKNYFLEAMEDVIFGSVAGIAGKFIEYPFDTVKVRLQSQPSPPIYTGPLDCFRQSYARDGLNGLYRGISAPLVGAALENSSLFLSEQLAQKMMFASGWYKVDEKLPLSALFVTGGAAGAVTSLVLTPVELVKCKMQVPAHSSSASHKPPSILGIIRDVYRHNGMKGFWHGQMGTFIRESGGGAAWFGSKETLSALFRTYNGGKYVESREGKLEPLPLWQQAVAGASAGMSYNFLFFPADTIKSRMQTSAIQEGGAGKVLKQTFMSEGRALWKAKGLRGMYAGCGITVFRSAPSSAFVFIIYDGMKSMFPFA